MREYFSPERPTFDLRAVPSSAAHAFHPACIELLFTIESPQHTSLSPQGGSHVPCPSLLKVYTFEGTPSREDSLQASFSSPCDRFRFHLHTFKSTSTA